MKNMEESVPESCSRVCKCPQVIEQESQIKRRFMCHIKVSYLYPNDTGSLRSVSVEVILSGLHFRKISLSAHVRVVGNGEDKRW